MLAKKSRLFVPLFHLIHFNSNFNIYSELYIYCVLCPTVHDEQYVCAPPCGAMCVTHSPTSSLILASSRDSSLSFTMVRSLWNTHTYRQ